MKTQKITMGLITSTELFKASGVKNLASTVIILSGRRETVLIVKKKEYILVLDPDTEKILYMHYQTKSDMLEAVIGAISLYGTKCFEEKTISNNINGTDLKDINKLSEIVISSYRKIMDS